MLFLIDTDSVCWFHVRLPLHVVFDVLGLMIMDQDRHWNGRDSVYQSSVYSSEANRGY